MEKYSKPIPDTKHALQLLEVPIPVRQHALHLDDPRNEEELVRIDHYGLEGISYYARKNSFLGEPITGVTPTIWLRKTVTQKLAAINHVLQTDPEIIKQYGQPLKLWISEGFRDICVQNYIYDVWFPKWFYLRNPGVDAEKMQAARSRFIARGTEPGQAVDPLSPPPHYTGGAVDLHIRQQDDVGLDFGHNRGQPNELNTTDYYEKIPESRLTKLQKQARDNRRLLYWLMIRQDFVSNPNEWWHFDLGNQAWARLSNEPFAYYSIPPNMPKMNITI